MASPVPLKSQQLHNFSLPQLKWNKKNRRATDSPPRHHRSPIRDSDSDQRKDEHVEKDSKPDKDSKAKIYIRIRKGSKVAESVDNETDKSDQMLKKDEIHGEKGVVIENCENEEVEEPKTWNLRPRKAGKNVMNADNKGTMKVQENRTRGISNNNVVERNEKKQKFSVSLSREEIEEDFLLLTGSKPPRRPKKRTKTVQKQLDNVFPGLWLSSVTPDCYKVPDPPTKG